MKGTIYVIQAGTSGPVKIALTSATTLQRIAAGNPDPLIVRHVYEGDRETLRQLHEHHAPQLHRADWFHSAVLDAHPVAWLNEIDFDRDAQQRRLTEQARSEEHDAASLRLAALAHGART